jgi:hypothetical protein
MFACRQPSESYDLRNNMVDIELIAQSTVPA